jgi:hypothetical protein
MTQRMARSRIEQEYMDERADQFEERVLRPGRLHWLGIAAIGVCFTAIGFQGIRDGEFMGWFCAGFFGLVTAVAVLQFIPGASYLYLGPDGFAMCSFRRIHTYRWSDVEYFTVGVISSNKMVMFNFSPSYVQHGKMRTVSRALAGHECALPDTYGMKAEELAALLNAYRDRFIEQGEPDGATGIVQ